MSRMTVHSRFWMNIETGVERVAAVLREKEQITGEEFAALFENKPLPEKKPAQIESESAAESPASVQEVQE